MKARVIRPASHEEWLKEREYGIGASEVGAILGLSPFETPFSLWLKKTKQVEPDPENQAMKMGHLLEPVVAQLWEEATGEKVIKASAADIIYVHPEYDFMRATPDRIVRGRKKLLEIKTTVTNIDPEDLPTHWLAQCIYQQYVTGIHDCDLAWLVSGRYFGYANIPYDPEFAEFIAERVKEFWNDCVIGGKEPDLISVNDFAMKGSDPGTTIDADEETMSHIISAVKLNADIAAAEAARDAHKDAVKLYMGESEALTVNGKAIATWKTGARGRIFLLKNKNIEEINNNNEHVSE
jgi:putative phage-type endonuclease